MLDPEDVQFTPEELAAIQQNQAKSAEQDPRVLAATIQAQVRQAIAEMNNPTAQARIQRDVDRDTIYVRAENQRTLVSGEIKLAELQLRRELALLEYANREKITLDQLKAKLAIESGRNDLARELATLPTVAEIAESVRPGNQVGQSTAASEIPEAPGKAPSGMGFAL